MPETHTCHTCEHALFHDSIGGSAADGCEPEPASITCDAHGIGFYVHEMHPQLDCAAWMQSEDSSQRIQTDADEFLSYPPSSPEIIGNPLADWLLRLPQAERAEVLDAGYTIQGVALVTA